MSQEVHTMEKEDDCGGDASSTEFETPSQTSVSQLNVYTPLLLPSQSTSETSVETSNEESVQDKEKLPHPPQRVFKRPEIQNSSLQNAHSSRTHRSLVRPFFCCGSEISLVSLVEGIELKEKPNAESLSKIECNSSSEDEGAVSHVGLPREKNVSVRSLYSVQGRNSGDSSRPTGPRRKKKEKQSLKKKLWSLQFRGRWNRQWRVTQTRSNTHSCEPGYGTAGSPRSSRCSSRAKQMSNAASSSHFIDLSQVQELDRLFPVEDIVDVRLHQRTELTRGNNNESDVLPRQCRPNLVVSSSFLDILRRHPCLTSTTSNSSVHLSDSPVEDYPDLIMSRFVLPWQGAQNNVGLDGAVVGYAQVHTQVDFIHYLVPDLTRITSCSFYWGVMDRYEAERLLENKPEGTFLLRDSAQEDFLFSVSFRRYNRSLHARVEQWNHWFSFDAHDPAVFSAPTVCELMEHYKDSSLCMFFEPMLTHPLHRNFPFSLQHLSRAVICDQIKYDDIRVLPLPNSLKQFLQMYHYKQKYCERRFDGWS